MRLNIGEMKGQIDEMNAILINKSSQAQELLTALNDLINDDELEGKAFTAMKNYLQDYHKPIVKGLILAYDEIKTANTNLLNDLYTQVSSDDSYQIDVDNLELLIRQQQIVLNDLEEKARELSTMIPAASNSTNYFVQQQRIMISGLQTELGKVINFNNTHSSHYSLAEMYLENVATGISKIKGRTFDPNTRVITYDTLNMSWSESLNNGWKLKKKKKEEQKTSKVDYKELNKEFWNRDDGYFNGNWWQDPDKLEEVTAVLKSEAEKNGGIKLEDLVSQYSLEDVNLRLYALQALANTFRTGNYDEDILNALTVNYYAEGESFDIASKLISADDIDMLQKREKNISGRKAGDWLEGGGNQLIIGVSILLLAAYSSNQATIEQKIATVKQSVKSGSAYESYKKLLADNRGGVNVPKKSPISKRYQSSTKTRSNKIFTNEKVKWSATRPKGTHQTYDVYRRNDVDWNRIRTGGDKNFIGKTNAEAASKGLPPQLADGNFSTLHHLGQDSRGALVEASTRYHGVGKYGQDILHSQYGRSTPNPKFPIDRNKFGVDTREYWKWRVENK